jgi:hypothetical protein
LLKNTIQLNVSTETYRIYLNILPEKLGGDHLTITDVLNMFCASISVRIEACEEGLSQMQAHLSSGKYSACPVNAVNFNDTETHNIGIIL